MILQGLLCQLQLEDRIQEQFLILQGLFHHLNRGIVRMSQGSLPLSHSLPDCQTQLTDPKLTAPR